MAVIANTIADPRGDTLGKHPVWECTVDQMAWADNETNEDTSVIDINGVITQIVATYSAAAANMTRTIYDYRCRWNNLC